MAAIVYLLCALTSCVCAGLLWRAYRAARTKFLLCCSFCFAGLALNNVLLFVDLVIIPNGPDLSIFRVSTGLVGLCFLLYAFIWDTI